jgi:16S rRNA (guanine527-N7)-methyltransferase
VSQASELEPRLRAGLDQLGMALSDDQVRQCLDYVALIEKWNRVYNLTAVRDPRDMLVQHLMDSLAVVPAMRRRAPGVRRVLDVGSGAGLPGVVLAIACPQLDLTCVDAVEKKAVFLRQVAGALGLTQLHGQHARVELLGQDGAGWELVCSRAFATLADFVGGSMGALAQGGVWMAMKGRTPFDEMAALPPSVEVFHVEPLSVPFLDAQRCLVWMRRRA